MPRPCLLRILPRSVSFSQIVLLGGVFLLATVPAIGVGGQTAKTAQPLVGNFAVKVRVKNKVYVGQPLVWDGESMQLLRRDGRMTLLPVDSHDDYRVLSKEFRPYTRDQMIKKLKKEFGELYTISPTRHFLVVHPAGSNRSWAKSFEDLNQRFSTYFRARGHHLEAPEFPLVAVVLKTRSEFDRMLRVHHQYDPRLLGYYSHRSNRVITYDQSEEKGQNWLDNTTTVIHEAAHQTAFNQGVHSRYANPPRWLSEGLACMFEARGVYDCYRYPKKTDRINASRLWAIQKFIEDGSAKGKLAKILGDDKLFQSDGDLAYAYAWGLTFYLAETRSKAYLNFLTDDAKRKPFRLYRPADRIEAFAKTFGSDLEKVEARMFAFLKKHQPVLVSR